MAWLATPLLARPTLAHFTRYELAFCSHVTILHSSTLLPSWHHKVTSLHSSTLLPSWHHGVWFQSFEFLAPVYSSSLCLYHNGSPNANIILALATSIPIFHTETQKKHETVSGSRAPSTHRARGLLPVLVRDSRQCSSVTKSSIQNFRSPFLLPSFPKLFFFVKLKRNQKKSGWSRRRWAGTALLL